MSNDNVNLHNITNSFLDVQLASLASWKGAAEFNPRDHGGPYVVLQKGYDPEDAKVIPDEFVLGRTGKWIPLGLFYKLPVPERRAEFIFGTAAEVMGVMEKLAPKAQIYRPGTASSEAEAESAMDAGTDEMAEALQAGRTPKKPDAAK